MPTRLIVALAICIPSLVAPLDASATMARKHPTTQAQQPRFTTDIPRGTTALPQGTTALPRGTTDLGQFTTTPRELDRRVPMPRGERAPQRRPMTHR